MSPFERIQDLERRVKALELNPVKEPAAIGGVLTIPEDNPNVGRSTGPFTPEPTPAPKKAPGFIAFLPPNPPSLMISTPGGKLPSVEDWLQITVQQMAGGPGELDAQGVSSLFWTDDQARVKLKSVADDRGDWLGNADPNTQEPAKSDLVSIYVAAFRKAVTPV